LRLKLNAKAAAIAALGANLEPSIGMGWNKGAKTLAVWREREAREREEARLSEPLENTNSEAG
jgi:hypothetical protein